MVNLLKALNVFNRTGERIVEDASLAEHDKRFHPNGYKEGDSCEFRERRAKLDPVDAEVKVGGISGLFTGSGASYNRPSLIHVGTGEGSQVYGWGLYASSERGVAENYANSERIKNANNNTNKIYAEVDKILRKEVKSQQQIDDIYEALDTTERWDDVKTNLIEGSFDEGSFDVFIKHEKEFKKIHDELGAHRNIYEQTFFTNRAPGDESHLLKWYEPIDRRILETIKAHENEDWAYDGNGGLVFEWVNRLLKSKTLPTGERFYTGISKIVAGGSWREAESLYPSIKDPQAASEFLARADIDGIKYPVDSYGGKTVKDGDKAGWNYVSFRDDNIRIDRKFVDGKEVDVKDKASERMPA